MIKAIFFDLDGTLLPIDENDFVKLYFKLLTERVKDYGYDSEELIKNVWAGTKAMYANDGSTTNERVFWDVFKACYGEERMKDKPLFDDFYLNGFKGLIDICKPNPLARDIVDFCKRTVQYTVLTTNPIFPLNGQLTRMGFLGLKAEDFDYVTAYENSSFTKPNPGYFIEVMEKFGLKPEEVVLFGNNEKEDGDCAVGAEIKCYMVGDYVIKNSASPNKFKHIDVDEIIITIQREIEMNKNIA